MEAKMKYRTEYDGECWEYEAAESQKECCCGVGHDSCWFPRWSLEQWAQGLHGMGRGCFVPSSCEVSLFASFPSLTYVRSSSKPVGRSIPQLLCSFGVAVYPVRTFTKPYSVLFP